VRDLREAWRKNDTARRRRSGGRHGAARSGVHCAAATALHTKERKRARFLGLRREAAPDQKTGTRTRGVQHGPRSTCCTTLDCPKGGRAWRRARPRRETRTMSMDAAPAYHHSDPRKTVSRALHSARLSIREGHSRCPSRLASHVAACTRVAPVPLDALFLDKERSLSFVHAQAFQVSIPVYWWIPDSSIGRLDRDGRRRRRSRSRAAPPPCHSAWLSSCRPAPWLNQGAADGVGVKLWPNIDRRCASPSCGRKEPRPRASVPTAAKLPKWQPQDRSA
jgi:hypothetical protein